MKDGDVDARGGRLPGRAPAGGRDRGGDHGDHGVGAVDRRPQREESPAGPRAARRGRLAVRLMDAHAKAWRYPLHAFARPPAPTGRASFAASLATRTATSFTALAATSGVDEQLERLRAGGGMVWRRRHEPPSTAWSRASAVVRSSADAARYARREKPARRPSLLLRPHPDNVSIRRTREPLLQPRSRNAWSGVGTTIPAQAALARTILHVQ